MTEENKEYNPVITRGMVEILPSLKDDRITLPDVQKQEILFESKLAPPELDSECAAGDIEEQSEIDIGEDVEEHSEDAENVKYVWNSPCMMLIFEDSDLNCAIHHLMESLHDPFALDAVSVLLVQESLLEELVGRVESLMRPLDARVASHPCYKRSLLKIAELKPEVVVGPAETVLPDATPILVRDLPHKYLGEGPTGVITMHIFRTPFEATQIYRKEHPLPIASVSIWNERVSSVYEVIGLMKGDTFKVNCFNVTMEPIKRSFELRRYVALMHDGYHYETLMINGDRKIIVFPVGTMYGN
ncbi:hypothetical protein KR009_005969 [Drosophila setifemur]|nr:hypothetical protein KR009_005969 [Drosophila setifemur]